MSKRHRDKIANSTTDLVIEGFPRSANTYAFLAFNQCQLSSKKIAHHLHASAQVRYAVRKGIPTIVLIRHPREAIASLLVRNEKMTPATAIRAYLSFYSALLPLKGNFVTAEFSSVIADFGSIIGEVNEKYGTEFELYHRTREADGALFSEIDRVNLNQDGGRSQMLARPSADKERLKRIVKKQLSAEPWAGQFRRAELLYQEFTGGGID